MGKNSYFQIIHKKGRTLLKVFPGEPGGRQLEIDDILPYMDSLKIDNLDTIGLAAYINKGDFQREYTLINREILPENEKCLVTIVNEGEKAVAVFYPPSSEGKKMDKKDVLSDLSFYGVTDGIQEKVIDQFLEEREYCTPYELAVAVPPVQGRDAEVEYHFDVNAVSKPKLNEDGSVDFHHLGNIKPVAVGDKLATLTPADFGKPGITVTGKPLLPNKVSVKILRFGRNISISEDKCQIFSQVAGHVSLVDDLVMVSDVYDVPANVDASTGDIEYNGTVNVTGNVNTGYRIEAAGDIVVNGVVEGATLIAGGNIVLKRGMQGMGRGELEAEGNITAKFIENSSVRCRGTLMCDAVLHSTVDCDDAVSVLGKKGLINGGHISSFNSIAATTLGSSMGTSTVIEIKSDIEQAKELNESEQLITQIRQALEKMNGILYGIKRNLKDGGQITPNQIEYLKLATVSKDRMERQAEYLDRRCAELHRILDLGKNPSVRVEGVVNMGVKIMIKDITRIISDNISRCKFVKEGADIKSIGLY